MHENEPVDKVSLRHVRSDMCFGANEPQRFRSLLNGWSICLKETKARKQIMMACSIRRFQKRSELKKYDWRASFDRVL